MTRDGILRAVSLAFVVLPAWAFDMTAELMRLASEGRGPRFTDFWMTQVLLSVGSWAYLVPVCAAGLLWWRKVPGSGRDATPVVLVVYFLLASMLWTIAVAGFIEPLANPEAVI